MGGKSSKGSKQKGKGVQVCVVDDERRAKNSPTTTTVTTTVTTSLTLEHCHRCETDTDGKRFCGDCGLQRGSHLTDAGSETIQLEQKSTAIPTPTPTDLEQEQEQENNSSNLAPTMLTSNQNVETVRLENTSITPTPSDEEDESLDNRTVLTEDALADVVKSVRVDQERDTPTRISNRDQQRSTPTHTTHVDEEPRGLPPKPLDDEGRKTATTTPQHDEPNYDQDPQPSSSEDEEVEGEMEDVVPETLIIAEKVSTPVPRKRTISAGLQQRVRLVSESAPQTEDMDLTEVLEELANNTNLTDFRLVNNGALASMKTVDRNEYFELLGAAMEKNNSIKTISMVNIAGTDTLAIAVANVLSNNPKITSVNIESNMFEAKGVMALAASLAASTTIKEFRLLNQKKHIPTSATEALVAAVEANGVTTVCGVEVRDNSMAIRLDKAIRENLDIVRATRHRTATNEGTFQEVLKDVHRKILATKNDDVTELKMRDSKDFQHMNNTWQTDRLCECLVQNTSMEKIDLSGNHLSSSWLVQFAGSVLIHCTGLRELNLSRNKFESVGILAVAEALPKTSLARLRINDQKGALLGSEVEEALVKAFKFTPTLTTVNYDWRNNNHRMNGEKQLLRNADLVRANRLASVHVSNGSSSSS